MPPPFVRKTEGSSINATLTLNIQSSGTNRVFVVGVAVKSNSVITPTSIVFNGTENFTVERIAADGGDAQCFLYYLIAPSEVTADVVITIPGAARMVGYVALFTGVHQTNPFTANTNEAQGTDISPTVDISSTTDETCIDILAQVSAGPDTATAIHTEICNGAATGGGTDTRGAGQYVTGQTTRTMNWTMSDADHWNIITGALQESGATPVTEQVNLLVAKVVPLSPTTKTGAKRTVNLLVASMVALTVTATGGAKTTVSLLDQNIVPYAVTTAIGASASVNLLTQNIVPYSVSVKTGAIVPVNLLVQDVIPYAVTPRADNQVAVNLLVQKIVPNVVTTKIGATKVVSLLDQNIVPLSPTVKTSAKIIVPRLTQSVVPFTATPVVPGGNVVKVVNLIDQKIIQLASSPVYSKYVADGLVAYWKFDENDGIYAYDTKGNNTGELKGGITWDTGYVNSCCLYNGTDSYIEVQDDPSLDISGDMSFEFWLYPDSSMLSGVKRILSKREFAYIAYEIFVWNGKYAISVSASTYKQLPLDVEANKWVHIIITHGPSNNNYAKIYRNSYYKGQTLANEAITPNDRPLFIGRIWPESQWWKSKIDETRLYKKILSQAEITQNYNVTDYGVLVNLLTQKIVALTARGLTPMPPGLPYTLIKPSKTLIEVKGEANIRILMKILNKEHMQTKIDTHEEV
jgi:hypothetical protein